MGNGTGTSQKGHRDVIARLSASLEDLFDRTATRVAKAAAARSKTIVVMSEDEYEDFLETVEVLEDEGALSAIREGEEDLAAGRLRPYEDVRRELGLAANRHHEESGAGPGGSSARAS